VALNLYLDDCSNSDLLADLLRQAGHQVVRPTDAGIGLSGEDDDVHFSFAAANGLTIMSGSSVFRVDRTSCPFRKALGLDPETAVEASSEILPGNSRRQLHHLQRIEMLAQAAEQLLRDVGRRSR
jgi:hypothetical protein